MSRRTEIRSKQELCQWVEQLVNQLDQLLEAQGIADGNRVSNPSTQAALKNALGLWESLAQLLSARHN